MYTRSNQTPEAGTDLNGLGEKARTCDRRELEDVQGPRRNHIFLRQLSAVGGALWTLRHRDLPIVPRRGERRRRCPRNEESLLGRPSAFTSEVSRKHL